MNTIIKLEDIEAEVVHKRIRNIHLRVLPPDGKVRISAPFLEQKMKPFINLPIQSLIGSKNRE